MNKTKRIAAWVLMGTLVVLASLCGFFGPVALMLSYLTDGEDGE